MVNAKIIIALLVAINCYWSCGAALRRNPKVYNALITTDENLTSSRAYPVIQPTIHEHGIAHYPYGPYNPYSPYSGAYSPQLVRFGQPIAPGFRPRQQLPYPYQQNQFPPQVVPGPPPNVLQRFPGYPLPQTPPTAPAEQPPQETASTEPQQPVPPTTKSPSPKSPDAENPPQQMPNDKLPIPLNAYGLPPALIPLPPQYPLRNGHPMHLPPYGYNQYPHIYDLITGFREQYLPPYGYYPSHTFAVGPSPPKQQMPQPSADPTPAPHPAPANDVGEQIEETTESGPSEAATDVPFESIKNGSKSKNSAVPDVPPPPIPSGAKSKQS